MNVEHIARVCHEANRALCITRNDHSQVSWDDAPEWQKHSAFLGVKAVMNDPKITPEQLHEKWSEEKIKDGWVYGPEKSAENKTHPCLVLYRQLPTYQRSKDALFFAIASTLLFGIEEN